MTRAALLALADRCEREEATSNLNIAIARAVGWTSVVLGYVVWRNPAGRDSSLPKFVGSLDAAVTLVPEDPANPGKPMLWSITYDEDGVSGPRGYCGALGKGYHDPNYIYGHSEKSAALALCAVALKARAAAAEPVDLSKVLP